MTIFNGFGITEQTLDEFERDQQRAKDKLLSVAAQTSNMSDNPDVLFSYAVFGGDSDEFTRYLVWAAAKGYI
jgi:hypothetical protein